MRVEYCYSYKFVKMLAQHLDVEHSINSFCWFDSAQYSIEL